MQPAKLIKAILLPLTDFAILPPLVIFAILTTLGMSGGPMGIVLLVLLLPPVFRFQMLVLEATAKGVSPDPLDAENFSFAGSGWALFPLPLIIFVTWVAIIAGQRIGPGAEVSILLIAGLLLPSSLALLAITRSPLQSLNPVAISRIWTTSGHTFWIASAYLFATGWVCLQLGDLPLLASNFIQLVLSFSFFSLTGALIEPYNFVNDVYIPDALEPTDQELSERVSKDREAALGHAYVFITRGNREGGFEHLFQEIEQDLDPVAAWAFYFNGMFRWDNPRHALFFAQPYIHDALRHGENVAAIKAVLRCRLLDENFKPLREDIPALIEVAENLGNSELAAVLRRV